MERDLGLESWLGGWLIADLLRLGRCLRRFRLSPLTTLLEFVACLLCPVKLDFPNLVIYRQGGTAIAAESHFPIHVDFKPSAAAWAGKVDDLHENPFRITSTDAPGKTAVSAANVPDLLCSPYTETYSAFGNCTHCFGTAKTQLQSIRRRVARRHGIAPRVRGAQLQQHELRTETRNSRICLIENRSRFSPCPRG